VAYRISHAPVAAEVLVVETDPEPGGVIMSVRAGDLELEAGPDSFLVRKPWAMDLCYELELEGELVPQGATASQILTPRGLLPVPPVPAGPATPFATIRGGLHRLPDALADALGRSRLRMGSTVVKLGREEHGPFRVVTADAEDLPADAVVLTTPAATSADLLAEVAPAASERIREIRSASTAIALFVYPKGTNRLLPEASGFVTPRGSMPITAAPAVSKKWPRQAFGSRAVLRAFVGGAGLEE